MANSTTEITDVLTNDGIEKLKVGQILIFDKDGQRVELKISRLDKKNHRAWAKLVVTYRADEVVVTGSKNILGRRKRQMISEYLEGENGQRKNRK